MALFTRKSLSARGSALFLILIAVALFAALSYAVTQSGRGGGTIERENALLLAAQITSTANLVSQGVMRMTLTGTRVEDLVAGADDTQPWAGGGSANGFDNTDFCTSGVSCIFAREGGGIAIPQMPREAFLDAPGWVTQYFTGSGGFNGVEIDGMSPGFIGDNVLTFDGGGYPIAGIGSDAPDYYLWAYPLREEVCAAINRGLGIQGIWVNPGGVDPNLAPWRGKQAFCIFDAYDAAPANHTYRYYHMLVER